MAPSYDIATLTSYDFFKYEPSITLAAIACALYILAALAVTGIIFVYKNARYMHIVSLTGLLEAGGYAALLWLTKKSGTSNIYGSYVAMQVLIILSPNLLQAADYWTVGKVLVASGVSKERRRLLRPIVVTAIFAAADLLALIVQASGTALWATSQGSGTPDQNIIKIGSFITLGGLAFQLVAFALFALLAVWTHRHPKNQLRRDSAHRQLFIGVYATIFLISLRNVYRFVEFLQNALLAWPTPEGAYVIAHQQVLFYCLDTLPILLSFLCFLVFHPARLLPRGPPPPPDTGMPADDPEDEKHDREPC